jgi:hypothetical protein
VFELNDTLSSVILPPSIRTPPVSIPVGEREIEIKKKKNRIEKILHFHKINNK